jgi:hypothetical protein
MPWNEVGTLPGAGVTDSALLALLEGPSDSRDYLNSLYASGGGGTAINVKDPAYGATGDGVTDDTDAINAAMDAVNPALGYMDVVIPDGTYMINGVNLSAINAGNRYFDAGIQPKAGTRIWMTPDAILKVIPNNSPSYCVIYVGPTADDVQIRGGQVVGDRPVHDYAQIYPSPNYNNHELGYGIVNRGAKRTIIEGVKITEFIGDGVLGSNSGHYDHTNPAFVPGTLKVTNCHIYKNRRNNISLIGNAAGLIEDNDIHEAGTNEGYTGRATGSSIPFNPRAGIDLEFGTAEQVLKTNIRGNRFVGNAGTSVNDFNGRGTVISDNFSDAPLHVGVPSPFGNRQNEAVIANNIVVNTSDTTRNAINLELPTVPPDDDGTTDPRAVLVVGNVTHGFGTGVRLAGFGAACVGNYISGFASAGLQAYQGTEVSFTANHITAPASGGTPSGILLNTSLNVTHADPKVLVNNNHIADCYYGMTFTNLPVGVTVKGNEIIRGFTAFNVGGGTKALIEGNTVALTGHSSGTQGNDVVYGATSDITLLGNTFRGSTSTTILATSGGSGGASRIIGNKIIDSTAARAISCTAGTHDVVDNKISVLRATAGTEAIFITGASVNSRVIGNKAWATGAAKYAVMVNSSTASGSPATQIFGNDFDGARVVNWHSSDIVGGNNTATGYVSPKRVFSVNSTATLTPDVNSYDTFKVVAQTTGLTVAAPTGSPSNVMPILYRISDNGSARRSITWNSAFAGDTPTSTLDGTPVYVLSHWNADTSKWDNIYLNKPSSGGGGAVDSVNGQSGDVVLTAPDVGAEPFSPPVLFVDTMPLWGTATNGWINAGATLRQGMTNVLL